MAGSTTIRLDSPRRDQQRFQYLKSFFQERSVEHQLFSLIDHYTHRTGTTGPPVADGIRTQFASLQAILSSSSPPAGEIAPRFARVLANLARLSEEIVEMSARLRPGELRGFLERYPAFGDANLLYLATFYLSKEPKQEDDHDIIDLIVTRLATVDVGDAVVERRPQREIESLSEKLLGAAQASPEDERAVEAARAHLRDKTDQLARLAFGSLEEMRNHRMMDEVRRFKRSLGPLILAPQVLAEIADYNITAGRLASGIYQRELKGVEDEVVRLHVMLDTLEREAARDPGAARQFALCAREVQESFETVQDGLDADEGQELEATKLIDGAAETPDQPRELPPTAVEVRPRPTVDAQARTTGGGNGSQAADDFVVSDEASGAVVEQTSDVVEALRSIAADNVARSDLALDLAPLAQSLEAWEMEAFREGDAPAAACIRTMVALRMKIVRFDAWRRKEVGRQAAMKVSASYLVEAENADREAQAVINDLLKEGNLDVMRNVTSVRSKLLMTTREIRTFVEEVVAEMDAGKASAGRQVVEPWSDAVVPLEAESLPSGESEAESSRPSRGRAGIHFPVPRARPKAKAKGQVKAPPGRAGHAKSRTSARRLVVFFVSLFALSAVSLYLILDDAIESRYRGQTPTFAEFDIARFSSILPLKSAKKIRDVVEVVVASAWVRLDTRGKTGGVESLFRVLRPSGVSQVFVFNEDYKMVASCLNGRVSINP